MEWAVIRAPARLHLGFIPSERGDALGSAAVAISEPYLHLRIRKSGEVHVSGPYSDEFFMLAEPYLRGRNLGGIEIVVESAIRRHTGLGSGTRMALAVGMGIDALYGIERNPYEIAEFFGRGRNSRAGLETLIHGGISVVRPDGTAENLRMPEDWVFVVAIPEIRHGFYGEAEREVMRSMKRFPYEKDMAGAMTDAIRSSDIEAFGHAITELDSLTGRMFSGFEGASDIMEGLRDFGIKQGAYGAGQSSWGPALYFLSTMDEAPKLVSKLGEFLHSNGGGSVFSAEISSTGMEIGLPENDGEIEQSRADNRIVYKS